MLDLISFKKGILVVFISIAFLTGWLFDYSVGLKADYWIHDAALVYQHRNEWQHSAIVTLDDGVPLSVGRKQALPLAALATERMMAYGAKAVFLDARLSKEQEGRMPYARCIEDNGRVSWSMPECTALSDQQCRINFSELGSAPLKMSSSAIQNFRIAPYFDKDDLPDFLLYGWEASSAIPASGLEASDRLVTSQSPIARWMDLSEDHAIHHMVGLLNSHQQDQLFQQSEADQLCDNGYPCRRIRLSIPHYKTRTSGQQLILPVSRLAACNPEAARDTAQLVKDKIVIFQLSAPNESTDLIVTPMTTAMFGPRLMTPGTQYLVDAIETIVNNDAPVPPPKSIKSVLLLFAAITGVLSSLYFSYQTVMFTGLWLFAGLTALCVFNPVMQLWPVVSSLLAFTTGVGQMLAFHLVLGLKEGRLVKQYLPQQVYNMLISLKKNESFKIRHCHAAVLMSDLAGYTTVTGLLKEPKLVLKLMNDYLEETSYILQKKYDGILETYVGDMVCYYWHEDDSANHTEMYRKALLGAIELHDLQKQFFITLQQRYQDTIDPESLNQINHIIDAGIGITAGHVVMGNLGPKHGIKKFGILGDPLNLAARAESLTRLFSTDIIVAGDLIQAVSSAGLVARRLGTIKVKGRIEPESLYAVGQPHETGFKQDNIQQWTTWINTVETGHNPEQTPCPDCYTQDKITILNWKQRNRLGDDGVWNLDEK
ncbi:MAG: CHASE2 domain-containing protein [Gammaproteobacteria bacterium]|nr:CHASE2 domain-containing protein [Gammaproteobacteria bacterium]